MKNTKPTYKQAEAFLRKAYKLKESLSDDVVMDIEVSHHGYHLSIFKLKGYEWDCAECIIAYFSLFSNDTMLTDEQNTQAINHCIATAHETIAGIGGFKTK